MLTRNLQDVFGENDPVRRRAAIDEIWTEDGFFQAEDGIRDGTVTGVQTCALPIWMSSGSSGSIAMQPETWKPPMHTDRPASRNGCARSEERRVGKECRSRWSP